MGKYKYLLKNIGLLTISNFASKLLSFFLVPLYTSVLSTRDYGTYDLFNTTISLLIPLLTLNIFDAVLRFALDKNSDQKQSELFSFGCRLTLIGSLIISAFVFFNSVVHFIPLLNQYGIFFVGMFIANAFSQLFSNFTRGLDKINDVAIAGVIATATGLLFNVWFLLGLKIGLTGYFLAGILSGIITCLYYFVRVPLYKYLTLSKISREFKSELLQYSVPMLLNSIGWWINNLSDRYIVTGMCGVEANGIYSVGYKIPSILNIFITIFGQAWTLSAVKDFDPDDKDGFFSNMYRLYNASLVIGTSLIICADQILAKMLYAKDFYVAWKYVPLLTMASMFGAIAGYFGGVFAACKDTKVFGNTTILGAAVNTGLNFLLVYLMGPIGAAIATVLSYFIVWALRLKAVRRYITFKLHLFRDCCSYVLLLLQAGILTFMSNIAIKYVLLTISLLAIIFLYWAEMRKIINKLLPSRI